MLSTLHLTLILIRNINFICKYFIIITNYNIGKCLQYEFVYVYINISDICIITHPSLTNTYLFDQINSATNLSMSSRIKGFVICFVIGVLFMVLVSCYTR